jgi:tetratricopeptide (TPR) repeat protein
MQLLAQLQAAKRTTEAIQTALGWLANRPSDPDLTAAVIRLCWTSKQWDDAIEVGRAAIEETDEPTRYETLLSQTLVHAGRFDEAIEMRREKIRRYERLMERAVGSVQETTLALRHRQAQYELIGALTSAEKYAEAERLIDSLLAPMRDANAGFDLSYAIDLRNVLSEIYAQTGRTDQAIEQLETVYEFVPQDATANNNLAYNLADAGRQIERAEEMVRSALSENPNSAAALYTLGWVLYKRGQYDDAAYFLRRALRAAQFNDPVIFDHLGDAVFRAGNRDEAARYWTRSKKICDPDGDPPPPPDRLKLHGVVSAKLTAVASGDTPPLAPLARSTPATAPASPDDL